MKLISALIVTYVAQMRASGQATIDLPPGLGPSTETSTFTKPTSSPAAASTAQAPSTAARTASQSTPAPTVTATTTTHRTGGNSSVGVLDEGPKPPVNVIQTGFRPPVIVPEDKTRLRYPQCPLSCTDHMIGDKWCNTECFRAECGNDGEECKGWCAPDCKPGWVGDKICDKDCFREECEWDRGDCKSNFERGDIVFPPPPHDSFDYERCLCSHRLLHNGKCDAQCNTAFCNWDGGDCRHQCAPGCTTSWLGDGECDTACFNEACGYDKGDCAECSPGCRPDRIGNGICDGACMTDKCFWDMGDCAGVCKVYPVDYTETPFQYNLCRFEWVGDGSCDCFCLNSECYRDKGDCQGKEKECKDKISSAAARHGGIFPLKDMLPTTPQSPLNEEVIRVEGSLDISARVEHR